MIQRPGLADYDRIREKFMAELVQCNGITKWTERRQRLCNRALCTDLKMRRPINASGLRLIELDMEQPWPEERVLNTTRADGAKMVQTDSEWYMDLRSEFLKDINRVGTITKWVEARGAACNRQACTDLKFGRPLSRRKLSEIEACLNNPLT